MKNHISSLFRLAIVTLAAFPAFALAAPTADSAYYTDVTNSYVQDQTSEVMGRLNGILCYMGAMAPDQMVNAGDANGNYIALVNSSVCDNKGSGGQDGNTGGAYEATVVHSARASSTAPMLVKVWVDGKGQTMPVYATATEAPSTTNPYGVFGMNFCAGPACANQKGFINATASGLTFYASEYQDATHQSEIQLKLNATGSGTTASGYGAIGQTYTWGTNAGGSNFKFAYNANAFVRNDSTGDICFDRSPANADESVWRYGLYDASTGTRITRKSGFPVEYLYTSANTSGTGTVGTTYNGYVGYYGLWMPVTVPSGSTVNKVDYSNNTGAKVPFTLYSTGGKLMKYTTANKTLADLNKITFWYYVPSGVSIPAGTPVMTGAALTGTQYELFWDDTSKQFMVSGKQNSNNHNMEPYTTPVVIAGTPALSNTAMAAANQWGLFGWSQMMGGMFGIKGDEFALLTTTPSVIKVVTQIQDVVYPSQFPASLVCINDCPTAALIATSNAAPSGTPTTPFENPGWSPVASGLFKTFTLNATTGNLMDGASAAAVSPATTGNNANGIRSGRLVSVSDAAAIVTAKNIACSGCNLFNQGDVDLLPVPATYYVWETGGQPWNQISYLMSQAATPVLEVFDAPLQVSYTVPANTDLVNNKPYGNFAGSTMTLQYGGFGDLWGIPNECIDITTNLACDFTGTPNYNNFRWASKFAIPFDAAGVKNLVTVSSTIGSATPTTYLAKPLDKEVRLAKLASCPADLTTTGITTAGLPTAADFVDPTATVGAKPTVTDAPQVIHGVKQY